jgi:D-beta-D-heptose 7-phosphate kinase/D-beta-D-heptose 1-phosphate adenosyltransferase
MDNQLLLDQFDQLGHPTVVVLGDPILDRYIWGNVDRVSPEAPVLVLHADAEEVRLGGAASVAMLLGALEVPVKLVGVVGNDGAGRAIQTICQAERIDSSGILVAEARPTTIKDRLIGRAASRHPQQMLRVDRESTASISARLEQQLLAVIVEQLDECDCLLVSDYAKGVCTPGLLAAAINEARRRLIPVFVDPGRIKDYAKYEDASVLTPNRSEAAMVTGRDIQSPGEALVAAREIRDSFALEAVLLKLDRDGMVLVNGTRAHHYGAVSRQVCDGTGAGDMVLAVLGLCRACGLEWDETVCLANVAAGIEVERFGVSRVTRKEIRAQLQAPIRGQRGKVLTLSELVDQREVYRAEGKTVAFTNGCFDVLHIGHVTCLQQAKELGDVLIVAINSDESVRRLKGPTRPIFGEAERAALLAVIDCVDHVVVFDDATPHALLRTIKPDILVKGGTYTPTEVVGREVVQSYGGKVVVTDAINGMSTSAIVDAIGTTCSSQ